MEETALAVADGGAELATREEIAVARVAEIARQFALARTPMDFKAVRDVAEAASTWAKRQGLQSAANDCLEWMFWSEWELGDYIEQHVRRGGDRKSNSSATSLIGRLPIGIKHHHSERCRQVRGVPREWLQSYFKRKRKADEPFQRADIREQYVEVRGRRSKAERAAAAADAPAAGELYELIHMPVADLVHRIAPASVDHIVTDPPYPEEYLPVYSQLARFAAHALKDGGSALVMVGQSYLPELIARLGDGLNYNWAVAYLTPGAEAVDLWDRRVASYWKPVLWFVKGTYRGDWRHDVVTSEKRDKEHHEWGQSESGMEDLIGKFTAPMDMICDPFLGGGATAAAAVKLKRRFIGADIDESCIALTAARLRDG